LKKRLVELREALEACRAAHVCLDRGRLYQEWTKIAARVSPVLAELEALEAGGKIDTTLLRATRIGAELNRAWWRREAHGQVAQRAAFLVLTWMRRCDNAGKPSQEGVA